MDIPRLQSGFGWCPLLFSFHKLCGEMSIPGQAWAWLGYASTVQRRLLSMKYRTCGKCSSRQACQAHLGAHRRQHNVNHFFFNTSHPVYTLNISYTAYTFVTRVPTQISRQHSGVGFTDWAHTSNILHLGKYNAGGQY